MKRKTRLVALILALAMLLCALPLSIFAAEDAEPQAQAAQSQTELTLDSVGVSLGSKIALDFYVSADADTIASLRSKLTVGDEVSVNPLSEATALPNGVKISALLSSIELASNVTLELIDRDGKAVEFNTPSAKGAVTSYTYSVKQYAESVLSDNTFSDKTKAAIKALVAYGIYAERFFLDVDSALTELLTAEEIANVADAEFGTVITDKGAQTLVDEKLNTVISADGDKSFLGSVRLVLDSYVKIRIELSCTDQPTVSSESAIFAIGKGADGYYVDITNISARNLNTVYTLNINGTVVTISLLAVAKFVADNEATYGESFANLAKALYNYYHYAHAYEAPNYFVYEDFSDPFYADSDSEAPVKYNDITFQIAGKTGAIAETAVDENGRSYLRFVKGSSDPSFSIVNLDSGSIATMTSNQVSYEFAIARDGSNDWLGFNNFQVESSVNMEGNSATGPLNLLKWWNSDGEVRFMPANKTITNIKKGDSSILTVRIVLDFEEGTYKLYDDGRNVIMTGAISIPANSGATTALEWKTLITKYFLYAFVNTGSSASSSIRFYGIKIAEGNIYEKSNSIVYNLGGGTLPENAPNTYSDEYDTLLPTPAHPTHVFEGWYTSPDFTTATKITRIPASTNGVVKVYAKWTKYFINEDFSDPFYADSDSEAPVKYNDITFQIAGKTGAIAETAVDENGRSYLRFVKGSKDPSFSILNLDSGSIATMTSNQVSYEFAIARDGNNDWLGFNNFQVESSVNMEGNSATGPLNLLKWWNSDGEVRFMPANKTITNIKKGDSSILTVRIVLDFEEGTYKLYDDGRNVIMTGAISIPANSGATTALEWKTLITKYFLYAFVNTSSSASSSIRFYGIKIAEGNIFE